MGAEMANDGDKLNVLDVYAWFSLICPECLTMINI